MRLPPLIEHVRAEGGKPVWICDPMHGNTHSLANGVKTRNFEDIYAEVEQSFDIHRAMGQQLGGVHIELTGENVTECIGGSGGLQEDDLARAYESEVDPRLNYEQSMELAFLIARKMSSGATLEGARVSPHGDATVRERSTIQTQVRLFHVREPRVNLQGASERDRSLTVASPLGSLRTRGEP